MTNGMSINKIQPNVSGVEIGDRLPATDLKKGDGGFDKVLRGQIDAGVLPGTAKSDLSSSLKFSAHAMARIRERSIPMGGELLSKLDKAVTAAAEKGAKDSLILSDDAAFIVSVKNKTVITVVDRNQLNGNVFTNIDSTVLI